MRKKQFGSNAERELLRKIWNVGWACIRVAGSGSTGFPAPDLVLMRDGRSILIEVKSTRNGSIYIREEQLYELNHLREISRAEVYIAAKFVGNGWYFFKLDDIMSDRRITLERAQKEGMSFREFVEKVLENSF